MDNILMQKVEKAGSIALTGHIRPDGDCTGSVLALYNYLAEYYPDKVLRIYLEQAPDKFAYLKAYDLIDSSLIEGKTDPADVPVYDLCVCLDAADKARLDKNACVLDRAKDSLAIDHHVSHKPFTESLVLEAEASSTCEVLASLLEFDKISPATAACLYTGLVHDTGVFKYPCTSGKTMELAGRLMEKGISFTDIIDNSFYTKSFAANQVLGQALLDAALFLEGAVIVSYTDRESMDKYGVEAKDLDGVIDQLRNTAGVEVALYLYALDEDTYKASLRSKTYVDVSRICAELGGGGHMRAAGCSIKGRREEIIRDLVQRIKERL